MGLIADILNLDLGLPVRNRLNAIIKFYNAVVKSDSLFNVERIDASFVKDATPTNTKFLRDDGTWQTVATNQDLEQTLANGESTGTGYTIYFNLPPVLLNELQAKVMTVNNVQQLVASSINIADIATKAYADGLVAGLLDDRGSYNASTNLFPSTGGSGTAGAILKGDIWYISVAGTLGGVAVTVGDSVRALVDAPSQTYTNWSVLETNIGYVPENVSNKATTMTGNTGSNIKFLSAKAIYDWAIGLFELLSNKQNSLAVDGTGAKYVTVDAINAYVQTKQVIQITSSTAPTISTTGFRRTFVDITAQASNINLGTNLSGTPQNGDVLWFQIKPTSSGYTIATTSVFENKGETIPTNLTLSKRTNIGFTWDSTTSKWGCIAQSTEA